MFSIGFIELLMVAIVGLLVMGPDRLPGAVREATVWIRRVRQYIRSVHQEIEEQIDDIQNDEALLQMRQGRQLLDDTKRDISNALNGPTKRGEAVDSKHSGPLNGEDPAEELYRQKSPRSTADHAQNRQ
ncbi:MAG: hypothetical protein Cons2KO_13310 [Congregibacter sp.]